MDIVRVFSSFSISPAKAIHNKNSELSFGSMILPAFTYVFFAIQLVIDRFSFVPTMSGIKALLTVFISLIVGVCMSLVSVGLLYSVLNLKSIKSDFHSLLLCSNFSYIIPLFISFIGFLICNFFLVWLLEHVHEPALYGIGLKQYFDELFCSSLLVGILQYQQ